MENILCKNLVCQWETPSRPCLVIFFMEFFEKKFLPGILPKGAVWFRYVDDIFCIWPINANITAFLDKLNGMVASIKFTIEEERDGILPFLDVEVHRQGRSFKFNVYRKPTNICSYIHYYSEHHNQVKLSVFSSQFLRALRICSPEFLDRELDKICNIGKNLKYPGTFLNKALTNAKKTFYSVDLREPLRFQNMLALPFHRNFYELPKVLKNFNITLVFKNSNTLSSLLIKNAPLKSTGCLYAIPCKDCDKIYLGQTGKELSVRLNQHKYSVRTAQPSSAIFFHMSTLNHPIDWSNTSKVLSCNDIVCRNIIESALIKTHSDKLLNLSPGMYKLDNYIIDKIVKTFKITV